MRNFLMLLFCWGATFSIGQADEKNREKSLTEEKVYVRPSQLIFDTWEIYVQWDDQILQIPWVSYDENGYYYSSGEVWHCPRCGFTNPLVIPTCRSCFWPEKE